MSLVIFTEEPSMKKALEHILTKLGIHGCKIIAHQGASDLEKSLPRKLKAWRDPQARFLILRDNDRGDCRSRKNKLLGIAKDAGRADRCKVRIVCQELEAWFIGDWQALEASRHFSRVVPRRLKTCDPDQLAKPADELKKLKRGYGKITGADTIAPHLDLDRNRSASFNATIATIREMAV